jgi:hypothetical protein
MGIAALLKLWDSVERELECSVERCMVKIFD